MNPKEQDELGEFLKKEFRALGCEQEAKWVVEEIQSKAFSSSQELAESIVCRRKKGEPLAYILGHWDFRKLRLSVGPGVLIPRPETEELVSLALEIIEKSSQSCFRLADLGAGSGAIAYSLATEAKKRMEIYAVEKSSSSFSYLQKNLPKADSKKIHLIHKDWEELDLSCIEMIVSNPPYVSVAEYNSLENDVKNFEPKSALVPEVEQNSYSAYESIFRVASRVLAKGGSVLCEFGPAQKEWNPSLFSMFSGWRTFKDLSGKERFLYAFDFDDKSR